MRMGEYVEWFESIRADTLEGHSPFGRRWKIAEINRGTQAMCKHKAGVDQVDVTKWLHRRWPCDLWVSSINKTDDDTVGYELWVSFLGTYKTPHARNMKNHYRLHPKRRAQ